jgi:hypothetical protein
MLCNVEIDRLQPAAVSRTTSAPVTSQHITQVPFERKITAPDNTNGVPTAFGSLRPPSFTAAAAGVTATNNGIINISAGNGNNGNNNGNGNYIVMPREDFMDTGFDQKTITPSSTGPMTRDPRFVTTPSSDSHASHPSSSPGHPGAHVVSRLSRADLADGRVHTPLSSTSSSSSNSSTSPPGGGASGVATVGAKRSPSASLQSRTLLSPTQHHHQHHSGAPMTITVNGSALTSPPHPSHHSGHNVHMNGHGHVTGSTEGMSSPFNNHSAYSLHNAADLEAPSSSPSSSSSPTEGEMPPSAHHHQQHHHVAPPSYIPATHMTPHHVPVDFSHYLARITAEAHASGRQVTATQIAAQFSALAAAHDAALANNNPNGNGNGERSGSAGPATTGVGSNTRVGYPPLGNLSSHRFSLLSHLLNHLLLTYDTNRRGSSTRIRSSAIISITTSIINSCSNTTR